MSHAGLIPVLALAEQTGLGQTIAEKVSITSSPVRSGSANPAPKLLGVIAGMCAGADSIDDLDMLRAGGMPLLVEKVYTRSTLGTLLREVSFGHARQLESVLPTRQPTPSHSGRANHAAAWDRPAGVHRHSLPRPVYGHAKKGAPYRHTKISDKQILRKELSPLATTISAPYYAPVISGMRLREGAIKAIPDTAWTPVRYPDAVQDPRLNVLTVCVDHERIPVHARLPNGQR